jgi:uncharacterized membrane-anchored protein YitT (DUF2179 family)
MTLKKSLVIIFGSFLLAVGINGFLVPNKVLDGGIIGIGLIIKYLWGFQAGLAIILLSIPIFAVAWFKYRNYFYDSLHGMLLSSFFIDLIKPTSTLLLLNPAFSSVIGGVLVGLGIGLMLRYKTSTGGTDLIAQFLSDFSGINIGILIFLIDAVVISIGGFLFSADTFLLSVIAIICVGLTTSICTREIDIIKSI